MIKHIIMIVIFVLQSSIFITNCKKRDLPDTSRDHPPDTTRYPAITLFKIDKTKPCVVLGKIVNIRRKPSSSSPIIATVTENSTVYLQEWENNEEKIGIFQDKWAKVCTTNNKIGFVFGAFIFEMKNLYNGFTKMHFSESEELSFNEDGTFKMTSYYPYIERIDYERTGTYTINGRKIIIQTKKIKTTYHKNKSVNIEEGIEPPKVYYISRYKKSNLLLDKYKESNLSIDDPMSLEETYEYIKELLKIDPHPNRIRNIFTDRLYFE